MLTQTKKLGPIRPTLAGAILATLPYLTLLGCAGVVTNIVIGFEEPHRRLFLVSAILFAAAPVGMALHLAFTGELSPKDKRAWIAALASFKEFDLFGAYFTARTRRQATERLRARARSLQPDNEEAPQGAVEQGIGPDKRHPG